MGTLVSPMRGAAVAMPAARRFAARAALADFEARLYIVGDDGDGGGQEDGRDRTRNDKFMYAST